MRIYDGVRTVMRERNGEIWWLIRLFINVGRKWRLSAWSKDRTCEFVAVDMFEEVLQIGSSHGRVCYRLMVAENNGIW